MPTYSRRLILAASAFWLCLPLWAAEPHLPAWAASANGRETNYLGETLQGGLITNDTERAFLQALAGDRKITPLIRALGYVAKIDYQPLGTVQYPGRKAEPTYSDNGYIEVQLRRMSLVFHATDPPAPRRQILVFARYSGWPGMNDTCVVITDDQFGVLDWRANEQSDMFESARYQPDGQRLVLSCRRRSGGVVNYGYDLTGNQITALGK